MDSSWELLPPPKKMEKTTPKAGIPTPTHQPETCFYFELHLVGEKSHGEGAIKPNGWQWQLLGCWQLEVDGSMVSN